LHRFCENRNALFDINEAGYTLIVTFAPSKWSVLWMSWTIVILMAGVLPLSNFVGHSHWEYIKWVPTVEQLQSPLIVLDLALDVIANLLLFVPFGLLYAGRPHARHCSPSTPVMIALALSCGIELYQVYCHNRSTSLLDILNNVFGAYLGLRLGARLFEKPLPVEPRRIEPIATP
jgi:glycopeptide antibiotics resistance protein